MSWTQGVQLREDLPRSFVKWADLQDKDGRKLSCIVWDETEPDVFYMDYSNGANIRSIRATLTDRGKEYIAKHRKT